MTLAVEVAILGAGPVALAHALFQARHGPVVLAGPKSVPGPAVEQVPAALLTLLLEFGIVPAELDLETLRRERLVAWEDPVPARLDGPACAHIERGQLVEALWRRVQDCPEIHIMDPLFRSADSTGTRRFCGDGWTANRLVDATGRRALTAQRRVHPDPIWVATTCTIPRLDQDSALHLASAADGYAYRLGSARWLTVGWVGPSAPPPDGRAVDERIQQSGAGWLVDDIDMGQARISRRVASVAVAVGADDPQVLALGDAAIGRDALASQGVALGLSDAFHAASPAGSVALKARHGDGLERHFRHLRGMLDAGRHRDALAWRAYRDWLDNQSLALKAG